MQILIHLSAVECGHFELVCHQLLVQLLVGHRVLQRCILPRTAQRAQQESVLQYLTAESKTTHAHQLFFAHLAHHRRAQVLRHIFQNQYLFPPKKRLLDVVPLGIPRKGIVHYKCHWLPKHTCNCDRTTWSNHNVSLILNHCFKCNILFTINQLTCGK